MLWLDEGVGALAGEAEAVVERVRRAGVVVDMAKKRASATRISSRPVCTLGQLCSSSMCVVTAVGGATDEV